MGVIQHSFQVTSTKVLSPDFKGDPNPPSLPVRRAWAPRNPRMHLTARCESATTAAAGRASRPAKFLSCWSAGCCPGHAYHAPTYVRRRSGALRTRGASAGQWHGQPPHASPRTLACSWWWCHANQGRDRSAVGPPHTSIGRPVLHDGVTCRGPRSAVNAAAGRPPAPPGEGAS